MPCAPLIFRQLSPRCNSSNDTWSKTSARLAEFKEPFGSFTGHRDEKRATGTRNGSTGLKR
ncbi:hypothetical protein HanRHA438_Chr07g0303981 [Helianthus annuus]|uniref:Uncharacterized protein n=1 Tax=Helianthus annuus TaxID=4232 RepID=A0A251SF47_HELAN|nr:hypothetical protein HanIR_Chr07g0316681 [Helianthus annuus]KAJ0904612.1 hypothetical protein HanPSC8_Chr07g0284261 [Helianthus annuus]KAJ0907868.1 hypothetical protein HanRHA438_Chr07g0303981 [Helianthus annuus]